MRTRLLALVESDRVQRLIVGLILINAVVLGLETSASVMAAIGPLLIAIDTAILVVFVLELVAKLVAYGGRFWRRPWNLFDLFVVGIALIPGSGPFSVLRALRLLRLVSMLPKLRFIVEALLRAIPGLISIVGLLALVFYVFAIIATGLFKETHPEWFGTLGRSTYTLFQVMTLESWSMGIVRPIMEQHPWAWAFFVPFILIVTFTVLNLFIAIIVDAMQRMHDSVVESDREVIGETIHDENRVLREELQAVQERLSRIQTLLETERGGSSPSRN